MRSKVLPAVLLIASLALPIAADAQEQPSPTSDGPIVLTAPPIPVWRTVPPSTDPYPVGPGAVAVKGLEVMRGTVLHGEGDLMLMAVGNADAVVRLPGSQLDAAAIEPGSLAEVIGLPTPDGILNGEQVEIWPATP